MVSEKAGSKGAILQQPDEPVPKPIVPGAFEVG